MTKKEQKRMIEVMYAQLLQCAIKAGEESNWARYLLEICKGEREHRRCWGMRSRRCGLSVAEATRYFACKWLLEGITGDCSYGDVFDLRLDCIMGHALAQRMHKQLVDIHNDDANEWLSNVDYAALME